MSSSGVPAPWTLPPFEYEDFNARFGAYMAMTICWCFIFTALFYFWSWFFSSCSWCPQDVRDVYNAFSRKESIDWCSRMNSTLHSLIVCIGLPIAIAGTKWTPDYIPLDDGAVAIRFIFCISIAYFIFDTMAITFIEKIDLWYIFVIHHVCAGTVQVLCVFTVPRCHLGTWETAVFLTAVEWATLFINWQSYEESMGRAGAFLHLFTVYSVYISWFVTRLLVPPFILGKLMITYFGPSAKPKIRSWAIDCVIPSYICAWYLTIFCYGVFFGYLTPAMIKRWKGEMDEEEEEAAGGDTVVSLIEGKGPPKLSHLMHELNKEVEESAAVAGAGKTTTTSAPASAGTSPTARSPKADAAHKSGFAPTLSHDQLSSLGHM